MLNKMDLQDVEITPWKDYLKKMDLHSSWDIKIIRRSTRVPCWRKMGLGLIGPKEDYVDNKTKK